MAVTRAGRQDFWNVHEDDPRLEGLDRADKRLLQMFNARMEPLRAKAEAAALQARRPPAPRRSA